MNRREFICLVPSAVCVGVLAVVIAHPKNVRLGRLSQVIDPQHGFCLRCKTTWQFVKEHGTNFTRDQGCFPLCEKCWAELTPETRLPYYRQLVDEWKEQGDPDAEKQWPLIRDAVLKGG